MPVRDRRAERRAATRAEILDAAWDLVRADGLAALAMRGLGARVGMRAQSLYAYFPAKHAIYDAMFADSTRQVLDRLTNQPPLDDPVDRLRRLARVFLGFCVEDPVRYQLLFQRTIPGFEPGPLFRVGLQLEHAEQVPEHGPDIPAGAVRRLCPVVRAQVIGEHEQPVIFGRGEPHRLVVAQGRDVPGRDGCCHHCCCLPWAGG